MLKKTALKTAFQYWKTGNYSVVFWDGDTWNSGNSKEQFKIIFRKEPRLSDIKSDLVLTLGEAYMHGIIDFEGSFSNIIDTMFRNSDEDNVRNYDFSRLLSEFKAGDGKKEKENIHRHYDLGNDFFSLWLDKTMSYSCAYFEQSSDTLEDAQLAKIDHSLGKLDLQAGERLLDIGCGWGWLVMRAAELYKVHATGITLSEEQYHEARKRVHNRGLDHLVDIRLINYMDLDPRKDQFDKIISIGMFEHVGKQYLPLYLSKVNRLLKDKGLFLLHSIMGSKEAPTNAWMHTYIFPGGYVPTLRETIDLFPEFGFHTIHLESLRRHYAKTLLCWYKNFERCQDVVQKKYDKEFVRMWSLYLQGCAAAFETGHIDVFQCLMSKGVNNELPMTDGYMYAAENMNVEAMKNRKVSNGQRKSRYQN